MADIGNKVSKENNDVKSAVANNLIYSTAFNSIKIKSTSTGSFTKTGDALETFTVAHGLSYTPGYKMYLKVSSRWYGEVGDDTTSGLLWWSEIDGTNLTIITSSGGGESFEVKAYFFADQATSTAGAVATSTASTGFKMSQSGNDVKNANEQDLIIDSALQTFKIVSIQTLTFSNVGNEEDTVAHGLSYTPAWFALVNSDVNFDSGTPTAIAPYLLVGTREVHVWSDSTNIGVRTEDAGGATDYTVKIAVLANKLE